MTKMLELEITNPGMQTTVQDHGREAYRVFGVPKAGPMDRQSAEQANLLLGNAKTNPVLEFTMRGPVIEFQGQGYIAITGGRFEMWLDGFAIERNELIELNGAHTLSIGKVLDGCRGYLGVAGNWMVRPWLNSCSTSPQNTRELTPDSLIRRGSRIKVKSPGVIKSGTISFPEYQESNTIRILAGPEYPQLHTDIIKEILGRSFKVSNQSNRMGYRLEDPITKYHAPVEVISSGVVPGTIQLTHSGQLVILMADAQTTGGYPRIANVISRDQDRLGQMKPGDVIRFQLVSLKEAHAIIT